MYEDEVRPGPKWKLLCSKSGQWRPGLLGQQCSDPRAIWLPTLYLLSPCLRPLPPFLQYLPLHPTWAVCAAPVCLIADQA